MDKSHSEDSKPLFDMDIDEWLICPDCSSEEAYHETHDIWGYNGHSESVVGTEINLRCPDCGLWTEI